MKLTEKQQQIVLESEWVVNLALKNNGICNNEDMKQEATLQLCACILRFDESRCVKWTTYAYSVLYLYIKKQLKKDRNRENNVIVDSEKVDKLLEGKAYTQRTSGMYDYLVEGTSGHTQKIVKMCANGIKWRSITKSTKLSKSKVKAVRFLIAEKMIDYLQEKEN